jgi:hypothetical protein
MVPGPVVVVDLMLLLFVVAEAYGHVGVFWIAELEVFGFFPSKAVEELS